MDPDVYKRVSNMARVESLKLRGVSLLELYGSTNTVRCEASGASVYVVGGLSLVWKVEGLSTRPKVSSLLTGCNLDEEYG